MHVNNYYRPIDHGHVLQIASCKHYVASVYCGKISCSCCSVRKDVVMGLYTMTFTFMLSSLPCLHTFWHVIPTFFNVFYSCLCVFLLAGNCTAEEISVALSSKIVD